MPRPPALDLTALSDEELRRHCRPRPAETRIERVGCGASSLMSIAVTVAVVRLTHPLVGDLVFVLGVLAFVASLLGLVALTFHLAGARGRPFRAELHRRCGWAPDATYLDEERRAFPEDGAPAYTVF